MWQWKDNAQKIVPKISYVKGFEPWGWVLGTGIYLEDVYDEIELMVQDLNKIFSGLLLIVICLPLFIMEKPGCNLGPNLRSIFPDEFKLKNSESIGSPAF